MPVCNFGTLSFDDQLEVPLRPLCSEWYNPFFEAMQWPFYEFSWSWYERLKTLSVHKKEYVKKTKNKGHVRIREGGGGHWGGGGGWGEGLSGRAIKKELYFFAAFLTRQIRTS